jgi:DNA-binding transcriptional LysR family regulator
LFSARSNHSEREWRLEDLEGRQQTVKTPKCIHVDNIDAIRRMATYGLGIALIPETKCREEIRNETLIHILPKLGSKPLPVQIVYPKQRFLARKIELVIPYIESALLKLANPSSFVSQ